MTFEEWAEDNPHGFTYHSLDGFDSYSRGNRNTLGDKRIDITDCLSDSITFYQATYSYDSLDNPANALHSRIIRYLAGELRIEQKKSELLVKCLNSGKRICS